MRSKTYDRIRNLLCQHWGIPQFEFDARQKAGEILLKDAIGAIECIMATDPLRAQSIVRYIYGERIQELEKKEKTKKQKLSQIQGYLAMLAKAKPKSEAEKIKLDKCKKIALQELEKLKNG